VRSGGPIVPSFYVKFFLFSINDGTLSTYTYEQMCAPFGHIYVTPARKIGVHLTPRKKKLKNNGSTKYIVSYEIYFFYRECGNKVIS